MSAQRRPTALRGSARPGDTVRLRCAVCGHTRRIYGATYRISRHGTLIEFVCPPCTQGGKWQETGEWEYRSVNGVHWFPPASWWRVEPLPLVAGQRRVRGVR
jgi:hypothetical protein